ncbi:MAG: hypothetical protein ABSG46_09040 [Candidatus Binataceae bacterium]|jgi:hypothetical protein
MHFTIYKPEEADREAFVEFWSHRYDEDQYPEKIYAEHIGTLTEDSVKALFQWKNGRKLSRAKSESIKANFIDLIGAATALGPDIDAQEFLERFPNGGAIWRIFWLHCVNRTFPIYDQHVHRAMLWIEEEELNELGDKSDHEKIELYLNDYLPFYRSFTELDQREVDRALWAFGKFLKGWKSAD